MRLIIVAGTKGKSGGNKVILALMSIFNSLGVETPIYCLDEDIAHAWAMRHPEIKQLSHHDIMRDDVLLVSEEFVYGAMFLAPYTLNYIIINQGIGSSLASDWKRNTHAVHKCIYDNAIGIIANSAHTKHGIMRVFNQPSEKIEIIPIPISEAFYDAGEKKNIISYMPRKNRKFQAFVINYLSGEYLDYEFVPIDNMNEHEVADVMKQSKFFLSFGGPEGLGMPPIEAAISKCKVIGFDGYGGKEYFGEPIFTPVNFYNHLEYIDVCDAELTKGYTYTEEMEKQRQHLKYYYSMHNLELSMNVVYNKFLKEYHG